MDRDEFDEEIADIISSREVYLGNARPVSKFSGG